MLPQISPPWNPHNRYCLPNKKSPRLPGWWPGKPGTSANEAHVCWQKILWFMDVSVSFWTLLTISTVYDCEVSLCFFFVFSHSIFKMTCLAARREQSSRPPRTLQSFFGCFLCVVAVPRVIWALTSRFSVWIYHKRTYFVLCWSSSFSCCSSSYCSSSSNMFFFWVFFFQN